MEMSITLDGNFEISMFTALLPNGRKDPMYPDRHCVSLRLLVKLRKAFMFY